LARRKEKWPGPGVPETRLLDEPDDDAEKVVLSLRFRREQRLAESNLHAKLIVIWGEVPVPLVRLLSAGKMSYGFDYSAHDPTCSDKNRDTPTYTHAPGSNHLQSSISNPGTRTNSFVLLVTKVAPKLSAWAAMKVSKAPIAVPEFSRTVRTLP
jgi:hypothetical protein